MIDLRKPLISQRPVIISSRSVTENQSAYFILPEFTKSSFLQCALLSFSEVTFFVNVCMSPWQCAGVCGKVGECVGVLGTVREYAVVLKTVVSTTY